MTPTVSVVIPTRDRLPLLRATLSSVGGQRGVEHEVVVVDDGSDEETAASLRRLAGGTVRVLRNASSRGVAAARNQGIEAARGTWIAFCDDDDLWAPSKLARQLAALAAADRPWAYTGAVKFEPGPVVWQLMPPPSPEEVEDRLAWKCIVPAGASNVVADRRTLLERGGFDENLKHLADWDMWLRLLEGAPPAAAPGIGVGYRLHPHTMSLNPQGILMEAGVLDRRWQTMRGGEALDLGPTHQWIAMSHLRAGRRGAAVRSYARAARTRPRQGLRGIARSLYPVAPTPAHRTAAEADARPALKKVTVVQVPDEMQAVLEELGGAAPTRS